MTLYGICEGWLNPWNSESQPVEQKTPDKWYHKTQHKIRKLTKVGTDFILIDPL